MSLIGRLVTCYAVADQGTKPIKHTDQTPYNTVSLEQRQTLTPAWTNNARQTPFYCMDVA